MIISCSFNDTDQSDGEGYMPQEAVSPIDYNQGFKKEGTWGYEGDPVTLKISMDIDEEIFRERYKEKVEAKFPAITLELMSGSDDGLKSEDLPDIQLGRSTAFLGISLDDLESLDGYIEETNFDFTIFEEEVIERQRTLDPTGSGQLYSLPLENNKFALFYNKDIFDLLGKSYPEDGMTWEGLIDLARGLTLERNQTEYKGLGIFDPSHIPFVQLQVSGTDPATGEVLFADHPNTKKYFEWLDQFRSIPAIFSANDGADDGFEKRSQNIAMAVRNRSWVEALAIYKNFNFGTVSVPGWEGQLNDGDLEDGVLSLAMAKQSKHKEAAWAVIAFLTSESQMVERVPCSSVYDERYEWFMRAKQ